MTIGGQSNGHRAGNVGTDGDSMGRILSAAEVIGERAKVPIVGPRLVAVCDQGYCR